MELGCPATGPLLLALVQSEEAFLRCDAAFVYLLFSLSSKVQSGHSVCPEELKARWGYLNGDMCVCLSRGAEGWVGLFDTHGDMCVCLYLLRVQRWRDGSAGKVLVVPAARPEFDPKNLPA